MAQDSPAPTASAEPSPPPAEPRYEIERPPEGLARGRLAVPAWVVGTLAGVIVIAVIAFLFVVRSRRKRHARYESIAPQSSRR